MLKKEFIGKTEEAAINLALYEMNINREYLIYKVLEEKKGLLSGKKIKIECLNINDLAEYAMNILKIITETLATETKIEYKIRDKKIMFNIFSENSAVLIGKKGKMLTELQIYINSMLYNLTNNYIPVYIDIENYKDKHNYYLIRDVKKIIDEVKKSKISIKLDPMNSYERKIIHDYIKNEKNIENYSEGLEPNRYIVINYKED